MHITFILLAHEKPIHLKPLIVSLLKSGSDIIIHYDKSSPYDLASISKTWELENFSGNLYFAKRIHVKWGEWSVVQATLECLYLAQSQGYTSDYYCLLSGSCFPIKPLCLFKNHLAINQKDFIEGINSLQKRWVSDGLQNERWQYFHFFNWKTHKKLFNLSVKLQKYLKIQRIIPKTMTPYIGSQWWSLRASTIKIILNFLANHPEVRSFYAKTWIPDESFFQTLVHNLIPEKEICSESTVAYQFTYAGIPKIYYDDHLTELIYTEKFFARKISHHSITLKQTLSDISALTANKYAYYRKTLQPSYQKLQEEYTFLKQMQPLFLMHDNITDYEIIARLPVHITILCSLDTSKKQKKSQEMKQPDTLIFGDLFNVNKIDFSNGYSSYAGYHPEHSPFARHNPGYFLRDIVFASNKKNLVFTMGEEKQNFLHYFENAENTIVLDLD